MGETARQKNIQTGRERKPERLNSQIAETARETQTAGGDRKNRQTETAVERHKEGERERTETAIERHT